MLGDKTYQKIARSYNGHVVNKIPTQEEWQNIATKGDKTRAEWWRENAPKRGTLPFNAFKRLSKAYGLYTRGYYYWARQLKPQLRSQTENRQHKFDP